MGLAYNRHFGYKFSHFGEDTKGHDLKAFGDTTGAYWMWDASADKVILDKADIALGDTDFIFFGDANDVSLSWNATNLVMLPVADDTGAFHIGDGTTDFDVKVFLSAATKYVLFDVGGALLTLEDVDLHLGDNDALEFGDAATGDVRMVWNATNLVITPAVDDTGAIYFGDGTKDMDVRFTLGAVGDYFEFDMGNKALEVVGDVRLDFSSATVAAANTDGGVIKAGTSGAPVTEDTADMKFISLYWDDGATSGDARGIYNRLYITGAGGGGESFRTFTTVNNVAGATAHGAHTSLSFGASGSLTGLGVAGRNTLHIPNAAMAAGGTYAAVQAEIWSDGASSSPASVTKLSFLRFVNDGNATGIGTVDDKAFLFSLVGGTSATGNVFAISTLRVELLGTTYYLPVSTTENSWVFPASDGRIDLSALTVASANTDGGIIKGGTSGARIIEDTADMRFINFNFDNGATSGDNRGMYLRLYLTGAAGGGEAARIFTTVEDVAGGTAHGAHISLNFGSTGSITGLGVASRNTLHLANQAYTGLGGTYAATQAEIWSDGANSDPAGMTELSLIRCVLGGNASGIADVDDDAYFMVLDGGTTGSGNIVEASITEANYAYSIRCKINGTVMYLMAASAVG